MKKHQIIINPTESLLAFSSFFNFKDNNLYIQKELKTLATVYANFKILFSVCFSSVFTEVLNAAVSLEELISKLFLPTIKFYIGFFFGNFHSIMPYIVQQNPKLSFIENMGKDSYFTMHRSLWFNCLHEKKIQKYKKISYKDLFLTYSSKKKDRKKDDFMSPSVSDFMFPSVSDFMSPCVDFMFPSVSDFEFLNTPEINKELKTFFVNFLNDENSDAEIAMQCLVFDNRLPFEDNANNEILKLLVFLFWNYIFVSREISIKNKYFTDLKDLTYADHAKILYDRQTEYDCSARLKFVNNIIIDYLQKNIKKQK